MEYRSNFQPKKPRELKKWQKILLAPFGLALGAAIAVIMVVVVAAIVLLAIYIYFHIVSVNGSM